MGKHQTMTERFYLKYEYLAYAYAKQIFNYERAGYEFQDVVQELRIKIYTSIIAYAKKWLEFKRTGRYKPVPIEFYIKTAMVNRTKDFIKQFNQEVVENVDKVPVESFDYGVYNTMDATMDLGKCTCEINGVDLFYKLQGREKKCFALYLKGFTIGKLTSIFHDLSVSELINEQLLYIQNRKKDLLDYKKTSHTVLSFDEVEN